MTSPPHFAELAQHATELRRLAASLVGSEGADDAVQDTLVSALDHRQPPRSVRPWLRQVLRNAVRANVRASIRRRRREVDCAPALEIPSPDDELERAELVSAIGDALEGLDEPYRSTLRRRFVEGETPLQIARELGDPPATVRWRVHEGLRRMRTRLDDRYGTRTRWAPALVPLFDLPPPR